MAEAPIDDSPAPPIPHGPLRGPALFVQGLRGFAMGAADVVPGVSGGTVALVLGIYSELVAEIEAAARAAGRIARGQLRAGWEAIKFLRWDFLIPLAVGVVGAVLTLARLIDHYLETQPVRTAAVFFGLVLGSLFVATSLVRRWTPPLVGLTVASALVTFAVLGLRSAEVADPTLPIVAGAGSIAICAMILPGISGSFILLMLGLYQATLDAIDGRDLAFVAAFGAGAVLGLGLFSSGLQWLLTRYEAQVLAVLVGLMAGSLRVLWPWPHGTETAELGRPDHDVAIVIILGLFAAGMVLAVGWFSRPGRPSDLA